MAADDKPAKPSKPDKAAADKPAKVRQAWRTGQGRQRCAPAKARPATAKAASKGEKASAPAAPRPKDYRPRMKTLYEKVVREAMKKEFSYENVMQIPRIEKIVLNMGVGEAVNDRKKVELGGQGPEHDRRPARRDYARAQVDCHLQGAR